jgi:hypothetical protein
MPLVQTRGAASAQGFGEFAQAATVANYIEGVFSCFVYTGTGANQVITNGIDLSTYGGLVWAKNRGTTNAHYLFDTVRGGTELLQSNSTDASITVSPAYFTAQTTGYQTGPADSGWNGSGGNFVSWTFREQAKFFDIVTYTGNSVFDRVISHNLGAVPAVIIIKCTNTAEDWIVRTTVIDGSQDFLYLNRTDAKTDSGISNTWSSTTFTVGGSAVDNGSGNTYVAYLFASNAGGFGLTGTDNVISCGSVSATGGTPAVVNLGYEPQWLLIKGSNITNGWSIIDNMRGFTADKGVSWLQPNTSAAEVASPSTPSLYLTSTGFKVESNESPLNGTGTYIYIAIRRGPMKVPTLGTSVFAPVTATAPASPYTVTTNFPVDLSINSLRDTSAGKSFNDRLRGGSTTSFVGLNSTSTAAETTAAGYGLGFQSNTSIIDKDWQSGTGANPIYWNFRRAPSFFDEVCYTGTGSAQNVTHNLTVAPELVIIKSRSNGGSGYGWVVGSSTLPSWGRYLQLNATDAVNGSNNAGPFNNTAPTSSVFTVNTWSETNGSGATYVAYLFATLAGVSKVFSYTGNGSSQTINCGFTAGSRFVMIKRTDSTGDWYVWDSARGIVAGNDPHLSLNTTAAEVTTDDSVDTDNTGFIVNQLSATNVNVTSATYIGLAIA